MGLTVYPWWYNYLMVAALACVALTPLILRRQRGLRLMTTVLLGGLFVESVVLLGHVDLLWANHCPNEIGFLFLSTYNVSCVLALWLTASTAELRARCMIAGLLCFVPVLCGLAFELQLWSKRSDWRWGEGLCEALQCFQVGAALSATALLAVGLVVVPPIAARLRTVLAVLFGCVLLSSGAVAACAWVTTNGGWADRLALACAPFLGWLCVAVLRAGRSTSSQALRVSYAAACGVGAIAFATLARAAILWPHTSGYADARHASHADLYGVPEHIGPGYGVWILVFSLPLIPLYVGARAAVRRWPRVERTRMVVTTSLMVAALASISLVAYGHRARMTSQLQVLPAEFVRLETAKGLTRRPFHFDSICDYPRDTGLTGVRPIPTHWGVRGPALVVFEGSRLSTSPDEHTVLTPVVTFEPFPASELPTLLVVDDRASASEIVSLLGVGRPVAYRWYVGPILGAESPWRAGFYHGAAHSLSLWVVSSLPVDSVEPDGFFGTEDILLVDVERGWAAVAVVKDKRMRLKPGQGARLPADGEDPDPIWERLRARNAMRVVFAVGSTQTMGAMKTALQALVGTELFESKYCPRNILNKVVLTTDVASVRSLFEGGDSR